jgi:hypothetical protein
MNFTVVVDVLALVSTNLALQGHWSEARSRLSRSVIEEKFDANSDDIVFGDDGRVPEAHGSGAKT